MGQATFDASDDSIYCKGVLQLNQGGTVTNISINLGYCPIWNLRRNRNEGSAQSFPEFIRMQCDAATGIFLLHFSLFSHIPQM